MKKNFLVLTVIAGAILTGCSNDEELSSLATSNSNVIGFDLTGENPMGRSTAIGSNNITQTSFNVFAFDKDGSLFMGTHDNEYSHNGVHIDYKDAKWGYVDPAEQAYWPSESNPLDFYAVNPVMGLEDPAYLFMSWFIHNAEQKIQYTLFDEYSATSFEGENKDVMYAISLDQTKNTNSGKVNMQFKHTLSQVLFKAKTAGNKALQVDVKGIKVHNFGYAGTFTFPKAGGDGTIPEATASNWEFIVRDGETDFDLGIFSIKMVEGNSVSVSSSTTKPVWLSDEDKPLLMIPQTLTKWSTTTSVPVSKAEADKRRESYLSIDCKMMYNGVPMHDTPTTTIYVPFGATWEPGKRYIYTLIFGGGYDDNGNEMLSPIIIEGDAVDWADGTSSEVPAE